MIFLILTPEVIIASYLAFVFLITMHFRLVVKINRMSKEIFLAHGRHSLNIIYIELCVPV